MDGNLRRPCLPRPHSRQYPSQAHKNGAYRAPHCRRWASCQCQRLSAKGWERDNLNRCCWRETGKGWRRVSRIPSEARCSVNCSTNSVERLRRLNSWCVLCHGKKRGVVECDVKVGYCRRRIRRHVSRCSSVQHVHSSNNLPFAAKNVSQTLRLTCNRVANENVLSLSWHSGFHSGGGIILHIPAACAKEGQKAGRR